MMSSSCLTLKLKLPRAKKVWKSFTSKLKIINLIRSSRPRPHHHHNNRPHHHQIIQTPRRRNYRKPNKRRFGLFKKRLSGAAPAPVYIDKLFREPASAEMILDQIRLPGVIKSCSKVADGDEEAGAVVGPGTTGTNSAGDDMWESLGFASPLLRGVDERAGEFIARFRAEMELQEVMARNL